MVPEMEGKEVDVAIKKLDNQFRERCKSIADRLPEDLECYNQKIGFVPLSETTTLCGCVGVHLHAILEPKGFWWDLSSTGYAWDRGEKLCAEYLGLDPKDLRTVLCKYGAIYSPFGSHSWGCHPRKVFENLAELAEISY